MNPKYTKGLSKKTAARRKAAQKIKSAQYKRGDKRAFKKDLPGDKKKTKPSKYSEGKGAGSLADIARKYNAPLSALRKIYKKGLAAWASSGHRPGASQHGWARARVMSVLKGGKARQVDSKEWAQIQAHRRSK
tara:strand:- start:153 stop:551 length:399 start_codon:yes stop_codon:yes gene_type:complete